MGGGATSRQGGGPREGGEQGVAWSSCRVTARSFCRIAAKRVPAVPGSTMRYAPYWVGSKQVAGEPRICVCVGGGGGRGGRAGDGGQGRGLQASLTRRWRWCVTAARGAPRGKCGLAVERPPAQTHLPMHTRIHKHAFPAPSPTLLFPHPPPSLPPVLRSFQLVWV
mgnify:CR=1 FL=1